MNDRQFRQYQADMFTNELSFAVDDLWSIPADDLRPYLSDLASASAKLEQLISSLQRQKVA